MRILSTKCLFLICFLSAVHFFILKICAFKLLVILHYVQNDKPQKRSVRLENLFQRIIRIDDKLKLNSCYTKKSLNKPKWLVQRFFVVI